MCTCQSAWDFLLAVTWGSDTQLILEVCTVGVGPHSGCVVAVDGLRNAHNCSKPNGAVQVLVISYA